MTSTSQVQRLAEQLHSLAIHLLRDARRHDPESGIAPAQLSALSVLAHRGTMTLGELAETEQVSRPSMTRTVDQLERHGLVRRARDKHDRRVVYALATREGQRLLTDARQRRLAHLAGRLEQLSDAERDILLQACRSLDHMLGLQLTRR